MSSGRWGRAGALSGALALLGWSALAGVLGGRAPESGHATAGTAWHGSGWRDDASCRVCHPGATVALRRSAHAGLLETAAETACTACHGDLSAHTAARAAGERGPEVPAVRAQACAACHDTPLDVALGAHPLRPRAGLGAAAGARLGQPVTGEPAVAVPDVEAEHGALQWSAMLAAGYRFLDRDGSRDRYKTDLNLDRGFLLREAELELFATGEPTWLDALSLRARDIGDPYQSVRGEMSKQQAYRAAAGFDKAAIHYRAEGDYHRVQQKKQSHDYSLSVEPLADVEVFASFRRSNDDGFWLTNRIGNLNLTPQTAVAGVASPRQLDTDRSEVGVRTPLGPTSLLLAVEYREEQQHDRWVYARPSPVNSAFIESEDFTARSALRGPGARAVWTAALAPLTLEVSGRVLDLERRVIGDGTGTGFDIGAFQSGITSFAEGDGRTWLLDATATLELGDRTALLLDARWVDHREEMRIDQTETVTYTGLGGSSTVQTTLDQHTAQRQLEGSLQLEVEPLSGLRLAAGYGGAREQLAVPDLEAGDGDFRRGTLRNHGGLASVDWRPDAHWTFSAEHRQFGQNAVQLHEITEDRARATEFGVRYRREQWSVSSFARERQRENDVSQTLAEVRSAGLSTSWSRDDDFDLSLSYVFSDVESRTLTNFYFDPDPNPVPTLVTFDGETHHAFAAVTTRPSRKVRWLLQSGYSDTDGSFDVRLWDWQTELSVEVWRGGEAGVAFRYVDYADAIGSDDYDAAMTFVYWRQRLGQPRRTSW